MADEAVSRRAVLRAAGLAAAAAATAPVLGACANSSGLDNLAFAIDEIPYGSDPQQVGELNRPLMGSARPVAVLLHGGYWKVGFTRQAMNDLASDLARIGYAAWNLDYRRVGDPGGGGWPSTLEDVAKGIDKLTELEGPKQLDLKRVVFIGHSAGAQLAFWAAARNRAAPGAVGGRSLIEPKALVSLSGVLNLTQAAQPSPDAGSAELSQSAQQFVGGPPSAMADRYAQLDPTLLLPYRIPQLLLHGSVDDRVPITQSRNFAAAAQLAGDSAKLVELKADDHFDVVKSNKAGWSDVTSWLQSVMGTAS